MKKQLNKVCKENILELLLHSPHEIYSLTKGEFSAFQTAWMEACSGIYSHARLRKALPKPEQGNHNPAYGSWEISPENLVGRCLVFLTGYCTWSSTCMFGTSQMHLQNQYWTCRKYSKTQIPNPVVTNGQISEEKASASCHTSSWTELHVLEQEYISMHFSASASLKYSVGKHQGATYMWSELPFFWTSLFSWEKKKCLSPLTKQTHPMQEFPSHDSKPSKGSHNPDLQF